MTKVREVRSQPVTEESLMDELAGLGAMVVGGGRIDRHDETATMKAMFTDGSRITMTGIDVKDALIGLIDKREAELNADDGEGMEFDSE